MGNTHVVYSHSQVLTYYISSKSLQPSSHRKLFYAGVCVLKRILGWELGVAPSSLPVSLLDIAALSETRLPEEGSIVIRLSGVAYQKMHVAFMELDVKLALCFCKTSKNPPSQ